MTILQWMTGGTATKYEGSEEELSPRPMKKDAQGGKWDIDMEKQAERARAQRDGKR